MQLRGEAMAAFDKYPGPLDPAGSKQAHTIKLEASPRGTRDDSARQVWTPGHSFGPHEVDLSIF